MHARRSHLQRNAVCYVAPFQLRTQCDSEHTCNERPRRVLTRVSQESELDRKSEIISAATPTTTKPFSRNLAWDLDAEVGRSDRPHHRARYACCVMRALVGRRSAAISSGKAGVVRRTGRRGAYSQSRLPQHELSAQRFGRGRSWPASRGSALNDPDSRQFPALGRFERA